MLCFTVQGAVLVFFVSIYVAYLSLVAFALTFVIVGTSGVVFHRKNRRLSAQKAESAAWERRFYDRLTDFLDGFKEVRLNSARSDDLFDDASEVSKTAANIKIRTQAETFRMIVTSQISMYILLGAVVFVAPNLSDLLGGSSIAKATTALLFVVGACFGLVQSIPILCCSSPDHRGKSNGVAATWINYRQAHPSRCHRRRVLNVDGRLRANVLYPARSPRNARLAAEAGLHVRRRRHQQRVDPCRHQCRRTGRRSGQKPGLWAASLFLIALFLFFKSQQFVTITATAEIEAIIHKLRVRLMDMIRHSELLELERIGRSRIVAAVTSDTAVLTQASNMLCFTVQGAVLIFFVGLYVAYLSLVAFALTVVIVTGAGFIFHHKNKRLGRAEGRVGGLGAPAIRPADRFPRRLQGGQAQRGAQR